MTKIHLLGSLGAILLLTGPADALGTVEVPNAVALFASVLGLAIIAATVTAMRRLNRAA